MRPPNRHAVGATPRWGCAPRVVASRDFLSGWVHDRRSPVAAMGGPPSCRYRPLRDGHRRAGRSAAGAGGGGPVGGAGVEPDPRAEGHRGGETGGVVGRGERGVGHASFLSSAEVYFTPV